MTIRKRVFLTFTVSLLLLTGCEKKFLNYRNKWVGDYKFCYSTSFWNVNGENYESGEQTANGKVYYNKDGEENEILVEIDNGTYNLEVSKSGKITSCGWAAGSFKDKNTIEFKYQTQKCTGALGGGWIAIVSGTKQK